MAHHPTSPVPQALHVSQSNSLHQPNAPDVGRQDEAVLEVGGHVGVPGAVVHHQASHQARLLVRPAGTAWHGMAWHRIVKRR